MALRAFHANPSIGGFGGESTLAPRLKNNGTDGGGPRRNDYQHLPEHGDALCQIVKELVDNAVDACDSLGPNQKVKVEIFPYENDQGGAAGSNSDENILQLKISDTGIGMDDVQQCVEAFRTSKDEGESNTAGRYGIGLTLCLLHAQRLVPDSCACITSATKEQDVFTRAFYVVDTAGDSVVCKKTEEIQKSSKDESGTCVSVLVPGGHTAELAWKRLANYFTRFRLRSGIHCNGPNIEVLAPTLSKQPIFIRTRLTQNDTSIHNMEDSSDTVHVLSGENDPWEDALEDAQEDGSKKKAGDHGKILSSAQQKLEPQRRAVFKSAQSFMGCQIKLENVAHSVQKILIDKENTNAKSVPTLEVDVIVNPDKPGQMSSSEGGGGGGEEPIATMKLIRMVNHIPLLDGAEGCACGLVHGLANKLIWGSFGLHVAQSNDTDKVSWTPTFDVRDSDQVAPFFQQQQHGLWEGNANEDDSTYDNDTTTSNSDRQKRKHGMISRRPFPPAKARLGEVTVIVKIQAAPSSLPLPTLSKGRLPLNHAKIDAALQLGLRDCLRSLQRTNPELLLTPTQLRSAVREIRYIPATATAITRILCTQSDTELQARCIDYIRAWRRKQNDSALDQNNTSPDDELQEATMTALIEDRLRLAVNYKQTEIDMAKRKRGRNQEEASKAEQEYSDLDGSDSGSVQRSSVLARDKPSGTPETESVKASIDSSSVCLLTVKSKGSNASSGESSSAPRDKPPTILEINSMSSCHPSASPLSPEPKANNVMITNDDDDEWW